MATVHESRERDAQARIAQRGLELAREEIAARAAGDLAVDARERFQIAGLQSAHGHGVRVEDAGLALEVAEFA